MAHKAGHQFVDNKNSEKSSETNFVYYIEMYVWHKLCFLINAQSNTLK